MIISSSKTATVCLRYRRLQSFCNEASSLLGVEVPLSAPNFKGFTRFSWTLFG
jgi:hypothetical protein